MEIIGLIMDEDKEPIGIRYEQGGYPPLSFHFKDGVFYVIARSDSREFIPKGGCHPPKGWKGKNYKCQNYPLQQVCQRLYFLSYLLVFC